MKRTSAPRHPGVFVSLGLAVVLFVARAKEGAGLVHSPSKTRGSALQSVYVPVRYARNGLRRGITEQPGFAPQGKDSDSGVTSWLEQAADETGSSTPGGQRISRWKRIANRLTSRGRKQQVSEAAPAVPQQKRSPWGRRVVQHLRRAGALLSRAVSRVHRRVLNWWKGRPDQVRFHDSEPGDVIVARLLQQVLRADRPAPGFEEETGPFDDCASSTYFPVGARVQIVSELTGVTRTVVRGRHLGKGGFGVVFEARDVETDERFVLKAAIEDADSEDKVPDDLKKEAFFYRMLPGVTTPQEAQNQLRLMVASDVVKVAGAPPAMTYDGGGETKRTFNFFLAMPKAETDLEEIILALCEDASLVSDSDLGRLARLQLSIGVVQAVANLHDQGLVHVDIKPRNFLVTKDGRVFLSDFGTCEKETSFRRVSMTPLYCPPEEFGRFLFGVYYTRSIDAWQVGLALYRIWCKEHPTEYIFEGAVLQFTECPLDPPKYVKRLILGFLRPPVKRRLLPLRAMRTREFRQMKKEVEKSLPQFKQQTPPAAGEPQSVLPEDPSLADAAERPGEGTISDMGSTTTSSGGEQQA